MTADCVHPQFSFLPLDCQRSSPTYRNWRFCFLEDENGTTSGIDVNISSGIMIVFIYAFFDKVFEVMTASANFPHILAVMIPNVLFGGVALWLIRRTKR